MGCPVVLNGITKDCKSRGGVKNIWIADYKDLDIIESDATGAIITLTEGLFEGKKYEVRTGVAVMESAYQNDEQAGTSFVETTLTANFARMDKVKRLEIVALAKGEVVALIEDYNGKYWFLGYDEGVVLSEGGGSTGQAAGDSNSYNIVLLDTSNELPFEVLPEVAKTAIDSTWTP